MILVADVILVTDVIPELAGAGFKNVVILLAHNGTGNRID